LMRLRVFLLAVLVGLSSVATFASHGFNVAGSKQWGIVSFVEPVRVQGYFLMGPVLIVHDDAKMARGEACTTFYRFDAKKGQQEALVTLHCQPVRRPMVATTTLTYAAAPEPGCTRLIAYQLAGDT